MIGMIAPVVLVLQALILLTGHALYKSLSEFEGFSYKTILLGRRWDLGNNGMRICGAVWVVPAAGFIIGAVALLAG
jgi:hypothetical protein